MPLFPDIASADLAGSVGQRIEVLGTAGCSFGNVGFGSDHDDAVAMEA